MKLSSTKNVALMMFAIATTALVSCKKDKNDGGGDRDKLLTTGSWIATSETMEGAGANGDLLSLLDPCERDNTTSFKSDSTYSIGAGATHCDSDPTDGPVDGGKWKFTDGKTKIVVDGVSSDIVELTSSSLKIKTTQSGGGLTITMTTIYKHI